MAHPTLCLYIFSERDISLMDDMPYCIEQGAYGVDIKYCYAFLKVESEFYYKVLVVSGAHWIFH